MSSKTESKDRLDKHLKKLNIGGLFDELSSDYLEKAGLADILNGIPVPIAFGACDELTTLSIALNMARVVGGDSHFLYKDAYIAYIKRIMGDAAVKILVSEGAKAGGNGEPLIAAMYFRTALDIDPKDRDALYLYGRACKDSYDGEEEDREFIGDFRAESIEIFEVLTMIHPDFAYGFYFLGYAYVNLGLYMKAKLTWETFVDLSSKTLSELGDEGERTPAAEELAEMRDEIRERVERLKEPVEIERGCNRILSGDFIAGKEILQKYAKGPFETWWPIHYHLGTAETAFGNVDGAISCYKKALRYSPGNIEVMEALVAIYDAIGDEENIKKYTDKIKLVKENMRADMEDGSGANAE